MVVVILLSLIMETGININHYNNNRNTSNTVANNKAKGDYGDGNRGSTGVNNNMRHQIVTGDQLVLVII